MKGASENRGNRRGKEEKRDCVFVVGKTDGVLQREGKRVDVLSF